MGYDIRHHTIKKRECVTDRYRGPSLEGYMLAPSTEPHCPMAINMGIPAAFFVSDPRLWATDEVCLHSTFLMPSRIDALTPCNNNTDGGICSRGDEEDGKVPGVHVIGHKYHEEISWRS